MSGWTFVLCLSAFVFPVPWQEVKLYSVMYHNLPETWTFYKASVRNAIPTLLGKKQQQQPKTNQISKHYLELRLPFALIWLFYLRNHSRDGLFEMWIQFKMPVHVDHGYMRSFWPHIHHAALDKVRPVLYPGQYSLLWLAVGLQGLLEEVLHLILWTEDAEEGTEPL